MTKNLNEDLYKRFGISIDKEKVENAFFTYVLNKAWDMTYPLRHPEDYNGAYKETLGVERLKLIDACCRELFLDSSDYQYKSHSEMYMSNFLEKIFGHTYGDRFEDTLMKMQIFLNICSKLEDIQEEFDRFVEEVIQYIKDFPILGISIKVYKSKAPQIFPTSSEKFTEEIKNTLGLLELDKKYQHILSHFENGLKEFLMAKTQLQYKDVIEDMYTACDELIKVISNKQSKGFAHIADKDISPLLTLNGHQKELFKHLRIWMDDIKHGTNKNFTRKDTEMIVSLSGSLIRFALAD